MSQEAGDEGKRNKGERTASRVLVVLAGLAAVSVLVACFVQDTPKQLADLALGWPLILYAERAALAAFLVLGLGGLGYRLWRGDQVQQAGPQQVGVVDPTKPAEVLKESVDQDVRDLSERVTEVERRMQEREQDEA
jgi:hypothetical protein